MSNDLRNEFSIELGGETRSMRATFEALRGIERDLKTNLIPLIDRFGRGDVGVEMTAVIIYHGLQGFGDSRLSLNEVGKHVMEDGLSKLMEPVVRFLGQAMGGVSLGKDKPAGEQAPA